jgi:uncharacterized protein (DUF58 family)
MPSSLVSQDPVELVFKATLLTLRFIFPALLLLLLLLFRLFFDSSSDASFTLQSKNWAEREREDVEIVFSPDVDFF